MADRYWVGANNAQWTTTSTAVWSASSGGPSGASVPTSADNVFFTTAGSYNVFVGGAVSCASLTISSGAPTIGIVSGSLTIYGSYYSHSAAASPTFSGALPITFAATTAQTITTNGVLFSQLSNITFNGVGGSWQLQDNFAIDQQSGVTVTLTNGTLNLNGKTFTCPIFSSSNSNTRTIAFGSTGKIIIKHIANAVTVFTTSTTTGLSVTGTPVVEVQMYTASSFSATVNPGALSESQAMSFLFTSGIGVLTFPANAVKSVDFTGFAGTWAARSFAYTIYGNLTISTGMSIAASAGVLTLGATSGTQLITTNGKTFDGPITINGIGGTVRLVDALTMGATRALVLNNGTFDGNSKTISGASSITMATGSVTATNIITALAITQSSGTLTQGAANTFGAYTLTSGTLTLGSYTLTCASFSSSNSSARTIDFGTGNITCNGAGGTLWTTNTSTNLTIAGTPVVNISYSGAVASSVLPGVFSEASAISFNFTAGTYSLTFLSVNGYTVKNVNFTGFAGTWAARVTSSTIYGNLTLASGMTFAASSGVLTFGATSGTKTITTNGITVDTPITMDGVGGTFQLIDALTMGSTRTLTLTNGTLDLFGKTLTNGTSVATAAGTKNITFNGGTIIISAATTTAWNNAAPTGFTTTAGTGTGKISMTATTAKTFVGGGSTYNCTLSNDGAGALTISGSNTFTTMANGVQPTTFTFTSGTTQTVANWSISGISGSLVTINSTSAGSAATVSKSSGIVLAEYVSLKDSTATGGATWYAAYGSTNVSGNTGWIFGQARYRVGVLGDTKNWTDTAAWSASSGGASGASYPIYPDAVIFDTNTPLATKTTLDINPQVYTIDASARVATVNYGSNNITITSTQGTVYSGNGLIAGPLSTSVGVVNISSTKSNAITVIGSGQTTGYTSFNFTGGNYALTFLSVNEYIASVDFTGFSGSWSIGPVLIGNRNVYGNITLSSTMSTVATTDNISIPASSTITTNGAALNIPLSFTGAGATYTFADAANICGSLGLSASGITIGNGTINLNGKTVTTNRFTTSTSTGTKNLTFNGGTLVCTNSGVTATGFNNAQPTGFTTTAGTGTGKISMTSASSKTFSGAGSTFNCTVSNDGAGALTISGANTISTITSTSGNISITGSNTIDTITTAVRPVTFTFTAGTTQTINNWSLSGTSGNLVTILSSLAGSPATLTKSSGTVSADYLSLKDSAATGGATWYAGANSTNVSGNSGWIFSGAPTVTSSGFFFMMGA